MAAKRSIKSHLGKILMASALLALITVSAPIIYILVSAFFMFDGNCTENSKPVEFARSLSQEQLADLNTRIMALSKEYPYTQFTNHTEPFIPDDLKYLNANYITLRGRPYIVLAKCNFSVGVTLWFQPSRNGLDTIKLSWDAPNEKSRKRTASEVLWISPS